MEENISMAISDFLKWLEQMGKDYVWSQAEVHRLDQLTQDYMHKLELRDNGYHEKALIADRMTQCRIERRQHKDRVAQLEPLVLFMESDKGKMTVSQLQQTLGAVRKAERTTKDRRYTPRVMTKDEFENDEEMDIDETGNQAMIIEVSLQGGEVMVYKGYRGSVEFSREDNVYFGKVLGVWGLFSYEGATKEELWVDFCKAVEGHIKWCAFYGEAKQHKQSEEGK